MRKHMAGHTRERLKDLLKQTREQRASDLHLRSGARPEIRVDGDLQPLDGAQLSELDARDLAMQAMNESQRNEFDREGELVWGFESCDTGRFRATAFRHQGSAAAVYRAIPQVRRSLAELRLPPCIGTWVRDRRDGLILITGDRSAGRSTTTAAMVELMNDEQARHVLTIERPVEQVHTRRRAMITQREVGTDTADFTAALTSAQHQDADVVVTSELPDPSATNAALTLAESGRLVIGTMAGRSAYRVIKHLLEQAHPDRREDTLQRLARTLIGISCQQLVRCASKDGGRRPAVEVVEATPTIKSTLANDKLQNLYGILKGAHKSATCTMNQSLVKLVEEEAISEETARRSTLMPDELKALLKQSAPRG